MEGTVTSVGSAAPINPAGGHINEGSPEQRKPQHDVPQQQLDAIVSELNEALAVINSKVSFSVDPRTKKVVIKVTDGQTQEVLRQIPPEVMLRVSARINELLGVLFDKTL